jgi:hypothetical protein
VCDYVHLNPARAKVLKAAEPLSAFAWSSFPRWSEADLKARRKGEPRKVELAWELRSQTTMPLAWIAERLNMGTRGHLAWLLQQRGKSRPAAPASQSLLRI